MKVYNTSESTKLAYGIFIEEVFGMKNSLSNSPFDLKNMCKRIIKTLRRAIFLNIITDKNHLKQINTSLHKLESSLKDKDFEPLYIVALLELIFLLLGDYPNNWQKKSVSPDDCYSLNKRRSLIYYQNIKQKVFIIFKAHTEKEQLSKELPFWKLTSFFRKQHSNKNIYCQEFIDWYSKNYPIYYSELF